MSQPARVRTFSVGLCLSLVAPLLAQQGEPESWRLAVGLIQRGLFAEAADQLRAFLKEAPRDPRVVEARYRLGVCELELGHTEQAVDLLGQAARDESFALRPECLYRLAGALQKLSRPAEAAVRFEEILKVTGEEHYLAAAAHYGAGEALRDAHQDARALPHFAAAARSKDDDPQGYAFAGAYQAGYAQLRSGDAAGALGTFRGVVKRWPAHEALPELWYLIGEAAHRAHDDEAATEAWRKAAAAGGEWADDARSGLASLARGRGDRDTAIAELRKLCSETPEGPLADGARVELAQLLEDGGAHDQALRETEAVLKREALAPALRAHAIAVRGDALRGLGRIDDALTAYAQALQTSEGDAAARIRIARGETLLQAGRAKDAVADFDAAGKSEDAGLRGDALYGLVRALHAQGEHDRSIAAAQRLRKELPSHRLAVHAAFAIAENLYAKGDHAGARRQFDAIPAEHELAAPARYKAAWSAWLAEDAKDALRRFTALCDDKAQDDARREEALSMVALAAATAKQPDDALGAADRYAARYPKGTWLARTERVAARVLRERNDLRGAAERLARAERSESGDGAASLALERADIAFQAGDYAAAGKGYAQHAGRKDALGARALEGTAWCAFQLGDDAACLRAIRAGAAHPAAGDVAPSLGELEVNLHQRAQDHVAAAAAAKRFLETWPEHPRAPAMEFALGTSLARGGDAKAARVVLERVVKAARCPRVDLAEYELAWACRRGDDEEAARAAFLRVAKSSQDPELADECRVLVGEALASGADRKAARDLLAQVTHEKHVARARYLIGQSWLADGDTQKAAAAFEAAAKSPHGDAIAADALFAAGETEHDRGRFAEASASLQELIEKHPDHARVARARLYLGECRVREGRPADVVPLLEQYLADGASADGDSGRARGHLWLGRAQQDRKDLDRAEREFVEAARLAEGSIGAEATFRIGEVRRARGDQSGAAEAFMKVAILFSDPQFVPPALLEAARCWIESGQAEKADGALRELREKYGDSEAAKQARSLSKPVGQGRRGN